MGQQAKLQGKNESKPRVDAGEAGGRSRSNSGTESRGQARIQHDVAGRERRSEAGTLKYRCRLGTPHCWRLFFHSVAQSIERCPYEIVEPGSHPLEASVQWLLPKTVLSVVKRVGGRIR